MQRLIFLASNLAVIAACPVYASPLSEFAKAHDVEFIVAGCLVMGIAGSIGGASIGEPAIKTFLTIANLYNDLMQDTISIAATAEQTTNPLQFVFRVAS